MAAADPAATARWASSAMRAPASASPIVRTRPVATTAAADHAGPVHWVQAVSTDCACALPIALGSNAAAMAAAAVVAVARPAPSARMRSVHVTPIVMARSAGMTDAEAPAGKDRKGGAPWDRPVSEGVVRCRVSPTATSSASSSASAPVRTKCAARPVRDVSSGRALRPVRPMKSAYRTQERASVSRPARASSAAMMRVAGIAGLVTRI